MSGFSFDPGAFNKAVEEQALVIQYLFSTVKDKKLVKKDFDAVMPTSTAGNKLLMTIFRDMVVKLTHEEQLKVFEISFKNNKNSNKLLNITRKFEMSFMKVIMTNDGEDVMKKVMKTSQVFLKGLMKYFANDIKNYPPELFQKIVLLYLNNGIDIELLFTAIAENQAPPIGFDPEDPNNNIDGFQG